MITRLDYDKDGFFTLNGSLKSEAIDFQTDRTEYKAVFESLVRCLLDIRDGVDIQLSDDNRILAGERVQVINSVDNFLVPLLGLAFLNSAKKDSFVLTFGERFEIQATIAHRHYLHALGKLVNVSAEDIRDFRSWMDEHLNVPLQKLISAFAGDVRGESCRAVLSELLYYVFVFRYKLEYV